jgi:putative CocE/NonD family hydrolase
MRIFVPFGAHDQRERAEYFGCSRNLPLSFRHDVLVFQTAPLVESTEVTGTAYVRLYASSSAIDTDFTARLIDVYPPNEDYPDGYAMNLTDSVIRARYRNGFQKSELMNPGEVYEFVINLPPTSNLFATGHRIRLDVSSSNFPQFDPNPNTGELYMQGGRCVIAVNTVYHDKVRPSCVSLPIIPNL